MGEHSWAELHRYEEEVAVVLVQELEDVHVGQDADGPGTGDELRLLLMGLAKDSKTRGWWHAHGDAVPAWFSVCVGLEQAATSLRTYESEFVPGLLQTAD